MSISDQDLQEFKVEATELLEVAEKALLSLDVCGDFRSAFDAIFRSFHNLKGAARMLELARLQSHMHEMETTLMTFKSGTALPKDTISAFLRGVDLARTFLDEKPPAVMTAPPVTQTPPARDGASDEFFAECDEIIERIANCLKKIESEPSAKENVDALYRDFHSLKGAAYLFEFKQLGDIAHLVESSLEPVRDSRKMPSKTLVDGIYSSLKVLELEIAGLKAGRPNPDLKGLITALAAELNFASLKLSSASTMAPEAVVVAATKASVVEKESDIGSIRVSVALLDNLMTLMGEMVLVRNEVLQYSSNSDDLEFSNLSKRLNAVTSEIQDEMMKTRMQPIGNVVSKFNRVVRDLSQDLGKAITLTLSGADTEVDKSLLEAIKDPLTHIVRNSCDHGIEMPEARRAAGKAPTGNLAIKAFHEGGQVVVEIADDGKGLRPKVLLTKALEKGLITEAQAKTMTEKEIFNLIFLPGFSTAAAVTNVSGRGVGMDVVRTNIEKIGGTVELASNPGRGTMISIRIPLTLAIVPALIVNSGNGIFAIPQANLVELVRIEQNSSERKIEYLQGNPVYRLRGNLLPLVDLNGTLELKNSEARGTEYLNVAVVSIENRVFGLIVDEVRDTADIVVKPLNRLLKSLLVFSGATILGDGSVALILDVGGVAKRARVIHPDAAASASADSLGEAKRRRPESQDYILVKTHSPTKHAIVLGYVHRLEEFKKSDIEYSGNRKVVRYRDALLHIVTTNSQLGYTNEVVERDIVPIIVVEKGGVHYGIEVDAILDTFSSDVDPLTNVCKQVGIFGNLNTPDELIVIIDPFELIGQAYPPAQPEIISAPARGAHRPLRILFAEDTVFFRKAISLVLSKEGHEVVHAQDGQEAYEIFSQGGKEFDAIVSDIEMPRMNGFDFARAVRSGSTNPRIPMLAVSSRANHAYIARGIEAGFNVYMEKLKPEILLNSVAELTGVERKAS